MPITTLLGRQPAATASQHPDAGVRGSQENIDQVDPGRSSRSPAAAAAGC
jgi:hypothetical protein